MALPVLVAVWFAKKMYEEGYFMGLVVKICLVRFCVCILLDGGDSLE